MMPSNALGTCSTWFCSALEPEMSKTKMYSFDSSGFVLPAFGPDVKFWLLKPLVRIISVFPSGLTVVVTACPTTKLESKDKPGFNGWKVQPGAASGVICTPVGMNFPFFNLSSSSALIVVRRIAQKIPSTASANRDTRANGLRVRPSLFIDLPPVFLGFGDSGHQILFVYRSCASLGEAYAS